LKLFTRNEIEEIVHLTKNVFDILIQLSNTHKDKLLPGYTHLQLAMPSSFGLWFGAYAESLTDDISVLHSAFTLANKNPLGSGAGYGGSFPLNRKLTTELLGFNELNYNVVYAQMNRGKMEKNVAFAISNIAATLSRLALDACLYMNQNFGFISFPDVLTTGSSIMPHKKNPDVWELIRAKCNKLQNLPALINSILINLPSGYHRDLQIIKEDYLKSFEEIKSCLEMTHIMLQHIEVKADILEDDKYKLLFTVETVNQLVNEGMPFRDAYIKVGKDVESGNYNKPSTLHHTHEGSIGNLCNEDIEKMMETNIALFPFKKIKDALSQLIA
ncbi:MAG: argininosuccinate lyase, partial [Chitinophagales bacterium]|nr:argininosuccinate lyase [Chitinophagales bacterium]